MKNLFGLVRYLYCYYIVKEQSYYWIGLNIVAGGPMQT